MSNYGLTLPSPITADVQAKRAAVIDPATGNASVPNVAKAKCAGMFIEDTAASAGFASIQVEKVADAVAGAPCAFEDSLTNDALGRLVPASGNPGDKVWCVGFARGKATAAGDVIDVLIQRHLVVI